jgi:hypothetical protein
MKKGADQEAPMRMSHRSFAKKNIDLVYNTRYQHVCGMEKECPCLKNPKKPQH